MSGGRSPAGDVTEDERDRLIALLANPLNLNEADRLSLVELPAITYAMADAILKLRDKKGGFKSFNELNEVDVLTVGAMGQIRPFVRVVRVTPVEIPLHGSVRLGVHDAFHDENTPGAYIRADLELDEWAELGWVALLAERPGDLSFVPEPDNGDDLPYFLADPESLTFDPLVKLYVSTDQRIGGPTRIRAIAGSYVAGFGERLTFDVTNRVEPDGWYKDNLVYSNYDTGDVAPRRGLFGGAVTLDRVELIPDIWWNTTAFGSWQKQRLYQYHLNVYDPDEVDDPYVSTKTYFNQEAAQGGDDGCFKEGRCHA